LSTGNSSKIRADKKKDVPARIFELFPVLKSMLNRRGGDLSGGQQQQLALGRALALDPKLLILDEPTEGIQPNLVAQIAEVLTELNKNQGLTILLVEQKLPFARKVADSFCIMDRGRAVASGAMSELGDEVVTKYLKV
jgi:urea transport system ATP-binding protein